VPADGEVVSIEKFDKFAKIARRNFELNGLSSKIKLFDGDAFDVIDRLPRDQLFDLVFIDGNKERYEDYVIKTEPLLAKNGIMIVDDCFYHGDVLNAQPSDAKGVGTKACMDYLAGCNDWLRIALPLSNGLFMMTCNKARGGPDSEPSAVPISTATSPLIAAAVIGTASASLRLAGRRWRGRVRRTLQTTRMTRLPETAPRCARMCFTAGAIWDRAEGPARASRR
jgi:O-methyltransferase